MSSMLRSIGRNILRHKGLKPTGFGGGKTGMLQKRKVKNRVKTAMARQSRKRNRS